MVMIAFFVAWHAGNRAVHLSALCLGPFGFVGVSGRGALPCIIPPPLHCRCALHNLYRETGRPALPAVVRKLEEESVVSARLLTDLLEKMALVLNKKYKLASSENFDEVMKALGKYGSTFVMFSIIYLWKSWMWCRLYSVMNPDEISWKLSVNIL
jgi:hypothetical protein